jgi:two-component system response regulator YesN
MAQTGGLYTGRDAEELRQLAADFRATTGFPLAAVDREGRESWSLGACPLRARTPRSRALAAACRTHRRRAIEEAYRWGEPCISLCPLGLVTFAVPLARERHLVGGLASGFCVFPVMVPDIREEVRGRLRQLGVGSGPGPRSRLAFAVVSTDRLRGAAWRLFDAVTAGGFGDLETITESREKSIQQFTIAGYLEEARGGGEDLVTSLVRMQSQIIDRVVLGDLPGSREIINRFLGVIFLESGMNFDMLKVRLLELIVIISRAAMEKGISAEGLLGPRYSYLTAINAAAGFDDLFWRVTKALENFTRAVSEERGRGARARVARMKEFLSRRFASKGTAREVADAAGLSVSRALHLFRRETGMPLWSHVARLRVDYACYLLRNTERSMADVAAECGFYDQSHFARTFKAAEGVPPLRYRLSARGAQHGGPVGSRQPAGAAALPGAPAPRARIPT